MIKIKFFSDKKFGQIIFGKKSWEKQFMNAEFIRPTDKDPFWEDLIQINP